MWTSSDLEKLEKAIASGTLQVRFADKEVTYQSIPDMIKARDLIRRSINSKKSLSNRRVSIYNKGLYA